MRNLHFFTLRLSSIVLLFLLLTACSSHPKTLRIGVSQCSDDEWRHQMNSEILREALFYDHVEVEILTASDDNYRQAQDIRHFIRQGVDLLIVAPNEAAPITPVVEEAFDNGIPVIVIDRKILSDKYTAYIGADNYEIGKSVGRYVADMLGGRGRVVELSGLAGSSPAIARHQGFVAALSTHPDIQLLAQKDAAWLRAVAHDKMDALLDSFPHIDLVFAHNDRMAAGAYAAAVARGKGEKMRFIGIDALPGKGYGVEQVLAGELDATFIYPTGGDRVMQIAMNILNQRDFPRQTILSTSVVNASNASIMKMQTAHISALDSKIETLSGRMNLFLERLATQRVVLVASLLVLILLAGLLIIVYLSLRSKNRMNRELSRQKQVLEQQRDQLSEQKSQLEQLSLELETATHAKLVFFTNISHDFRTPLTLIADPIEQLLADASVTPHSRLLLELMKKNAHILLRLVNQILDFRKVENGRMEMRLEPFDIADNFRNWNESFHIAFLKKHITFSFDADADADFLTLADTEKMECIYFNLLSNAVKYTPENGKININLTVAESELCFTVFNSGSHISSADVESIFERFYQIDGHKKGTGIGLALVRAFVEMHQGRITAHSNEKGTTFTIVFPRRQVSSCASAAELGLIDKKEIAENTEITALLDADIDLLTDAEDVTETDSPMVLIIDDNADIRSYVKSLLSKNYRVLDAADAVSGIRLAMKHVPDVIVSDVMMPGMDGVECCRRLKSEMQTSHIPVVLLTACSLDEQRIQGYDGGADSYISKPFHSQLLLSRIQNLIGSRRQLRQFFGDKQTLVKSDICQVDKDFVTRFRELLEFRLQNSDLNVEDLGKEMGMSRVQLYRKLKSLTNYAPNELLRQARLKKAVQLLSATEMTVSEVAYEVGFSSPSYFTKCYKEEFGEMPTELLKRKRK